MSVFLLLVFYKYFIERSDKMQLYLSSYRLGNNTDFLKNWYDNTKKVLVIPNAVDGFPDGERKNVGIIDKCKELEKIGFETEILDLRKYFSKEKELKNYVRNYNCFYVIGGNTFILRQAMKLSGFDNFLIENKNNPNYLYIGFSAGICVLANDLHGINLADEPEKDPYNQGNILWDGVGLIDYMPIPHYDTPSHPESHLMYDVVKYMIENNLPYKTLHDGDVIIENLNLKRIK